MGKLKPQSNGPYSDMVTGTLAVDGWAVTFGTARSGPAQSPPRCTKCNSPPINGQCTNFIMFDVALYLPLHSGGLIGAVLQFAFLGGEQRDRQNFSWEQGTILSC